MYPLLPRFHDMTPNTCLNDPCLRGKERPARGKETPLSLSREIMASSKKGLQPHARHGAGPSSGFCLENATDRSLTDDAHLYEPRLVPHERRPLELAMTAAWIG